MKTVIVDIDGTIADCSHRLRHIQSDKKDWDTFFDECDLDIPIPVVIDLVKRLGFHYEILYLTGRKEKTHLKTLLWLIDNSLPAGKYVCETMMTIDMTTSLKAN